MLSHLAKILAIVAALQISGGHWTVLQSVAWVGMVVTYSQQENSLATAMEKTFDGEHPCNLCDAVRTGREADREQQVEKHVVKLEGVLVEHRPIPLPAQTTTNLIEYRAQVPRATISAVPTPPPRRA